MRKIFIFLLISCIGCTQNRNSEKQNIENRNTKLRNQKAVRTEYLKNKALNEGDDFIYGTYLEFAQSSGIKYEQLSVSLVMNHKFDSERSYYYIYRYMVELNNNFKYSVKDLANLNDSDRAFAMSYLIKGAKKNYIDCQAELERIYRNGYSGKVDIEKSDSIYDLLAKTRDFYARNRYDKSKVD